MKETATVRDVVIVIVIAMAIETATEIVSDIAVKIVNGTVTSIASGLDVIDPSRWATVMLLVVIPAGPKKAIATNPTRSEGMLRKKSRGRATPRKIPTRWNAKLATESGC